VKARCPNLDANPPVYSHACLEKIAGIESKYQVLSVLIPTVSYKVQTQFDYYKATGGFLPNPFPTGHTYYFSLTTDLRKIIPTIDMRSNASSILKVLTAAKSEPSVGECVIPSLPPAQVGSFFSFSLDDDDQIMRLWTLDKDTCDMARAAFSSFKKPVCSSNGLTLSPSGVLSGYIRQWPDRWIFTFPLAGMDIHWNASRRARQQQ
jgi:hypothetical protein